MFPNQPKNFVQSLSGTYMNDWINKRINEQLKKIYPKCKGNQFVLTSIINYLWFRVSSKSIFETNSKDTKVSIKKIDCPPDSWLIDTYLCNFYSLIIALDSVEREKLWSTLNWPQIKTFIWLLFRNAENEKPWLFSEAFPDTYTPTHSPFITPLAYSYLCMYYKAEQILVTCSVSSWRPGTNNESISFSLVPGIYIEFWGWGEIDWVLNKHRTIETIKLVIYLLLLIPPASWWKLSKLTAGWMWTVIKHDGNCWALKLYPSPN